MQNEKSKEVKVKNAKSKESSCGKKDKKEI